MKIIGKVISGGQTGADQAGLAAAQKAGIDTGGWAPRGWLTEVGPAPWLGPQYGLVECQTSGYPARTRRNVQDSDVTLWFGNGQDSAGKRCTLRAVLYCGKPHLIYDIDIHSPTDVAPLDWTTDTLTDLSSKLGHPLIVNVAGNRSSKTPGIEAWVRTFLASLFDRLEDTQCAQP